jgi:hypothetical protein
MTTKTDVLGRVHELLAKDMLSRLENGVPVFDKDGNAVVEEDGSPVYRPLTAAEWTAIAKFLKDNGIDSAADEQPGASDPFAALVHRATQSVAGIKN